MPSADTYPPRIATIVACDIVAPMVGGVLGAAVTAPSYIAPTSFQVAMSVASAGLVGHAAGLLCHGAVEVFGADPPSPTPETERMVVASAERRS